MRPLRRRLQGHSASGLTRGPGRSRVRGIRGGPGRGRGARRLGWRCGRLSAHSRGRRPCCQRVGGSCAGVWDPCRVRRSHKRLRRTRSWRLKPHRQDRTLRQRTLAARVDGGRAWPQAGILRHARRPAAGTCCIARPQPRSCRQTGAWWRRRSLARRPVRGARTRQGRDGPRVRGAWMQHGLAG